MMVDKKTPKKNAAKKKAMQRKPDKPQAKRAVQQVALPPEVEEGIKWLVESEIHDTMAEVYDASIEWFRKSRAKKKFNYYIASNKRGKYKTLWIDSALLSRARILAARDSVSIARVVYTAIVLYLEDKGAF